MTARYVRVAASVLGLAIASTFAIAGPGNAPEKAPEKKPDFPPFADVTKDLKKVVTSTDGLPGLYTLYANKKDGRLLAELPKGYDKQLLLIATTVSAGDEEAGVMGASVYATWKRIDKRLALMEPNFLARTNGDEQSKDSVKQLFSDRVVLDVPIVTMGPGGGPVIDLKALMVGQNGQFFSAFMGYGPSVSKPRTHLSTMTKAKSFPKNVEVAYALPDGDGQMIELYYSVRVLEKDASFKPRLADNRVGYFNVFYRELGKPGNEDPFTRYISRWNIQKADPSLKVSPPKQPLVWYIEHTTPIRYRRFVRDGILAWNEAYEKIGIVNALEVYQQDSVTGAHMEKDPEDARYNFFRWNTSTQGYAIGPSRSDPRTGQILDADVVWHAGLTDAIMGMLKNLSGEIAVSGFTPETLAWLEEKPQWDPRIRLASPTERDQMLASQRRAAISSARDLTVKALGDSDVARAITHDHWIGQHGTACRIGEMASMNIALFSAAFEAGMLDPDNDSDADDGDDLAMLDGLPEEFLGGFIKYIASHEVGHTLGLQHNFAASTIRSLEEINSEEMAGKPFIASVMEYAAPNINKDDGEIQGQYATPSVGPYDDWAIAFGYGPDDQREAVLARTAEPDHAYLTNVDMIGPDPRAQTWDMGADSINFAESRMRIIRELRGKLTDELVKDGEPWSKARRRYHALLNNQVQSMVIASRWIGGSYVHWDWKGDPDGRDPITDVDPDQQRRALKLVIENTLSDDAIGMTPDILRKLGLQFYPDGPGYQDVTNDPSYEVNDLAAGIQSFGLTLVLNPTTLRRLYDNEYRTAGQENAITLAEVFNTVHESVWDSLKAGKSGSYTAASPMLSSFSRNLQREHLERLIDLTMPSDAASPSMRTVASLSALKLRQVSGRIGKLLERRGDKLDDYTVAHLTDAKARIGKALDAMVVYRD